MVTRLEREPWRSLRRAWKKLPVPHLGRVLITTVVYGGVFMLRRFGRVLKRSHRALVVLRYGQTGVRLNGDGLRALLKNPMLWLARKPAHLIPAGDLIVSAFLSDVTGIGRAGRMTLTALEGAPVDVHSHDLRDKPGHNASKVKAQNGGVWISHCNPPESCHFMNVSDGSIFQNKYRIGYWAWELPRLPQEWIDVLPLFHEVWAPSRFVADAVERAVGAVPVKVKVVPHPLPDVSGVRADRTRFGLGASVFVFLSMYDTRSTAARKNPMGAVLAFQRAFKPDDDGVLLLVKAHSPDSDPRCLDPLRTQIMGWPNIRILLETLTDQDSDALIASADAFVSLHRSEGFGLSIAQAMALERAVVTTGWSGNVDFCEGGAVMVPYKLVPAEDVSGRYQIPDQLWADPDLDAAAAAMAELAGDPIAAMELGRRAREIVEARLPTRFDLSDLSPWLLPSDKVRNVA